MRIAIIGGLGFIGRAFSRHAIELGDEVDVYDMVDYAPTQDDGFNYEKVDLFGEGLEGLSRADALVVLAAKRPYAGFSFDDYEANVRIAQRCFSLARDHGVTNVVFASSKAVYSDQSLIPWDEGMYPTPLSLYGASKVAVEQLASLFNTQEGMAIKSLRFAQVIGMGERKGYLINTLIDNAIAHERQVVYGDGSQSRQYVYVKDVCRAIHAALTSPSAFGVFNIGMPGGVSNLELAECVNDVFGNAGNLVCDPSRPMGDNCDEMDVNKAERELGFKAAYDLRGLFEDIAKSEIA